jgi:hypothetical protein
LAAMQILGCFHDGSCARCNKGSGGYCQACDMAFNVDERQAALQHFEKDHKWERLIEATDGHIIGDVTVYLTTYHYGTK